MSFYLIADQVCSTFTWNVIEKKGAKEKKREARECFLNVNLTLPKSCDNFTPKAQELNDALPDSDGGKVYKITKAERCFCNGSLCNNASFGGNGGDSTNSGRFWISILATVSIAKLFYNVA